jgi:hypothetical protein
MTVSRLVVLGVLLAAPGVAVAQGRNQASALVEDVKNAPAAGVETMDFVFPDQNVALGANGELVLNYLSSCRVETIRGGNVTIGTTQSSVSGGKVDAKQRECDKRRFGATTQTAEAGAAVKRITPLDKAGPSEFTLKSGKPIFRWQGSGPATVRVAALDKPKPEILWTAQAQKSWIEYPANAPKLQPGVPYMVEIAFPNAPRAVAQFSIDPDLQWAETAMNRTVVARP